MHFSTLVAVDVPQIEEDPLENFRVRVNLSRLQQEKLSGGGSVVQDIQRGRLNNRLTAFSREVTDKVENIMEPYSESVEDPDYLEFVDMTDELTDRYETGTCTVIRLPNGKYVLPYESSFSKHFELRGGKVLQRNVGQLKQAKRTKKAKAMKVIDSYPYKKLFASFSEFATEHCGYDYYEDENAYGYYTNPNAFWDWYVIGGRWPEPFLVEETCTEYCISENYGYSPSPAPNGYRWVCAARKKDIQWDKMFELAQAAAVQKYAELKQHFEEKRTSDPFEKIEDKYIVSFGDILYIDGESLQEYLKRRHLDGSCKYPVQFYQYLSEESGFAERNVDYRSSCENRAEAEYAWDEELSDFIDKMDDECVLVCVDCHC